MRAILQQLTDVLQKALITTGLDLSGQNSFQLLVHQCTGPDMIAPEQRIGVDRGPDPDQVQMFPLRVTQVGLCADAIETGQIVESQ